MAASPAADASSKAPARNPSRSSIFGLDGLNFFLADVQSGVGPFMVIYLKGEGWDQQQVGVALALSGIAGIVSQTPAGALVDHSHSKRALIAIGIAMLGLSQLTIAFMPAFWPVIAAQVLIGCGASVFVPSVSAISLGLVGQRHFDTRQGRNQTANSAGNVFAALSMAVVAYYLSNRAIFIFSMALAVPAVLALSAIKSTEIDYAQARGGTPAAGQVRSAGNPRGSRWLKRRRHTDAEKRLLVRFSNRETWVALSLAGLVNMAMVAVAASVFHFGHSDIAQIETAYATLIPLLGMKAAGIFLLSLMASGISSSVVGTLAGQQIMQGFLGQRIPVWLRRLLTMIPAFAVVAIGFNPTQCLVISQVILSMTLPVPMLALLVLSQRRALMGPFATSRLLGIAASTGAAIVLCLNVILIWQTFAA